MTVPARRMGRERLTGTGQKGSAGSGYAAMAAASSAVS